MNHRYTFKRAVYLHLLAKQVVKDAHFADISWTFFRDDAHKPVLTIRPKNLPGDEHENVKTSFVINVIPMLSTSVVKPAKLLPDKANLHTQKESASGKCFVLQWCSIIADSQYRKREESCEWKL